MAGWTPPYTAPEGVATFGNAHPNVPVIAGALDEKRNEKGSLVPVPGDARIGCSGRI